MLLWRLILGTLFVAAFVGLCWLDYHAARPGAYLLPIGVVLSVAAVGELLAMFRRRELVAQPIAWAVYCGVLVTVLAAGVPAVAPDRWLEGTIGHLGWLAIGLVAAMFVAIVGELLRYESPGKATIGLALSCLSILYVGGLIGFLVQLRLLGDGGAADNGRWGMLAVVSLIATVKMSDTGQYVAGRTFGRHKLAPRISPGKTWEGVAGGFVFAILGAWISLWWGARWIAGDESGGVGAIGGALAIVPYALALAAAGIVGDLAESLLKRDAGVKDSSTWLPGFGGVLDMLDSLLVATPVAYLFWASGWLGT